MSQVNNRIPVFEHPPIGESSLDGSLGWVSDAAEACELLLRVSDVVKHGFEIPGFGKSVFGGVSKGHIRVPTETGPHWDAKGPYRWQPCFSPFYDSVENAGTSTPLDNLYIYKP